MEQLTVIFAKISSVIWGYPVLILMLAAGIYLTVLMRFPQIHIIRIFRSTIGTLFKKSSEPASERSGGALSQLQTFSTALAATVGTGSVAGVGTAIAVGGKGAIFWLWVSAFFGMALSYAENLLGAKYCADSKVKGAFVYMEKGLSSKWLALLFAFFCALASLGMGCMTQSNSISSACKGAFSIPPFVSGAAVLIVSAAAVSGRNSPAKLAERLVPVMSLFYVVGAAAVIIMNVEKLPCALSGIFAEAFSFSAASGGFSGYMLSTIITGLKRGAFSNEAGLGSTVAVHSSCCVKDPKTQGAWGMTEVFIDTMVISTLTALAVFVSGADISDGGADAVCAAFSQGGLGSLGEAFIAVSIVMFAFATMIGWFFIGQKAWEYIFPKRTRLFKAVFLICVYLGSVSALSVVWELSDIFNGLMAIPNLTALLLLSKEAADIHKGKRCLR